MAHVFVGDWTTDKLERVRKYLAAYTTIFKNNPKAAYFKTTYLDAFAGTGARVGSTNGRPKGDLNDDTDTDVESLQKGSARIALEVEPAFDHYVFIEKRRKRVKDLEALRRDFSGKDIQIERAEANTFLKSWCQV